MSLEILKQAKENLSLLRRTGSTTILKMLYTQLPRFVLVTNNYIYASKIKKELAGYNGRCTILSVLGAHSENLRGIHDPVAVDTSALLETLELSITTIEGKDRHIEYLENRIKQFEGMINWLVAPLQRYWPHWYAEKRWNRNDGRDFDHIDEAKRTVNAAVRIMNNNYRFYRNRKSTVTALKYHRINKIKDTRYAKLSHRVDQSYL